MLRNFEVSTLTIRSLCARYGLVMQVKTIDHTPKDTAPAQEPNDINEEKQPTYSICLVKEPTASFKTFSLTIAIADL
jgi:hypothetical protein